MISQKFAEPNVTKPINNFKNDNNKNDNNKNDHGIEPQLNNKNEQTTGKKVTANVTK